MRRYHYQHKFAVAFAKLILEADRRGYYVCIGEVQRTKEQSAINAEAGRGIKKGLHTVCMAGDLSLRSSAGIYLTETIQYTDLGEYWENMGNQWGGRFGDGNHFSVSYPREGFEGVK